MICRSSTRSISHTMDLNKAGLWMGIVCILSPHPPRLGANSVPNSPRLGTRYRHMGPQRWRVDPEAAAQELPRWVGRYLRPWRVGFLLTRPWRSRYQEESWDSVPSTINYDNISEDNGKNQDGAKIYVGWTKHAMFSDVSTTWRDQVSQGCSREYRSRDWW